MHAPLHGVPPSTTSRTEIEKAGAAQHLLDGRNRIKDLDVWTFFARRPDFGSSGECDRAAAATSHGRGAAVGDPRAGVFPHADRILSPGSWRRGRTTRCTAT